MYLCYDIFLCFLSGFPQIISFPTRNYITSISICTMSGHYEFKTNLLIMTSALWHTWMSGGSITRIWQTAVCYKKRPCNSQPCVWNKTWPWNRRSLHGQRLKMSVSAFFVDSKTRENMTSYKAQQISRGAICCCDSCFIPSLAGIY